MKVSVVLPCFNEKKRILPVVKALQNSKLVTEIIIVDDGSKIDTKKILGKIKNVIVLTHAKNKGKSQAMKTGLLFSSGDIVAFIDADLQNFVTKNIDDLVLPIINNICDITLSDRTKDLYIMQGFSAAYTGERAFRRDCLIKNISIFKEKGFLVEPAMNNRFFYKPNIRIFRVYFPQVSSYFKILKEGLPGQIKDIKMFSDYVSYLGVTGMAKQIYFAMRLPHSNEN